MTAGTLLTTFETAVTGTKIFIHGNFPMAKTK
jgi:hypothetical protein